MMESRKNTHGPKEDNQEHFHGGSLTTSSVSPPMTDSKTIFPFLSLPAELRAHILNLVAGEQDAHIIRGGPRHPLALDSVEAVNRQIRSEFIASLSLSSRSLVSKVQNFDFSHVIAFLDNLSPAALARLVETTRNTSREFRIDITITEYPPTDDQNQSSNLQIWLDYFDNPTNKGTDIRFAYSMIRNITGYVRSIDDEHPDLGDLCEDWHEYFAQKEPIKGTRSKAAQYELLRAAICECYWTQMDYLMDYEDEDEEI